MRSPALLRPYAARGPAAPPARRRDPTIARALDGTRMQRREASELQRAGE